MASERDAVGTETTAYGVKLSGPVWSQDSSGNINGLANMPVAAFTTGPVAPVADVTLADSGVAGNPNGQYWGKVTFVTALGESDYLTTIPSSVTVASKKITWSNIPVSSDAAVTARKLYRTVAGADSVSDPRQYFLVDTINDNTTTTYTDNVADGSLGAMISARNTARGAILNGTTVMGTTLGASVGYGQGVFTNGASYANIAFGVNVMSALTKGMRNSGFGIFALSALTTGSRNVGVGTHAINSGTTLNDHTGVGYGAGFSQVLSTTFPSTFIGAYAGYTMNGTTGGNTFVGYQAGQQATTANQNNYLGMNAGKVLLTGAGNNLFGVNAGAAIPGANFNSAFGHSALGTTTSSISSVVAVGAYAGNYATTSNEFFLNNQDRTNYAGDQTKSLLYGVFAAAAADQRLTVNGLVRHQGYTVATLPAAAAGLTGFRGYVTDANATLTAGIGAVVAAGGANIVPVFCDGTNWRIG